jgi:hypothetical protein
MTHTPGDWAKLNREFPLPLWDGDGRIVLVAPDPESEANFRVVMAASDLLAALGAFGVVGGGYCFCPGHRDPRKPEEHHAPECRDARRAIERATGEPARDLPPIDG